MTAKVTTENLHTISKETNLIIIHSFHNWKQRLYENVFPNIEKPSDTNHAVPGNKTHKIMKVQGFRCLIANDQWNPLKAAE